MREQPRLGRGLAALLGDALASRPDQGSTALTPVDDLEPNPFQPRRAITEEHLAELAQSIREQGLLQPILIRRHPTRLGKFQIIAGERRWRAARLAGLQAVPSYLRDLSDHAAGAAALVENLQRQDLNAVEEAEGFRRLIDGFGLTQDDLAKTIGKSRSHVANTLRLLHLPPGVLRHVRDGELTAGHARAALACTDPEAAARVMIEQDLNVRQAEALATAGHLPGTDTQAGTRPARQADPDLQAAERDLSERLGLQVSITFNGRGGRISLRYETLDQLDHVVAKLGR